MSVCNPTRNVHEIITVITDRVPEEFFSRFLESRDETLRLWIISPWITPLTGSGADLERIARKIERNHINAHIVTRPPEDKHHLDSLLTFNDCPTVTIVTLPNLHAKLYVMDNMRESLALLGSANLTRSGHSNIELGMLIRGQDWGRTIIGDLTNYAHMVRSMQGGEHIKFTNCHIDSKILSSMRRKIDSAGRDGRT